ncbi:hypothetical protein PENSPDRAFT_669044 [Peniophora sp. CONT]|nr:hypothetical protein PENSPDRAFT_669044 [Peniophora sp. CONT]
MPEARSLQFRENFDAIDAVAVATRATRQLVTLDHDMQATSATSPHHIKPNTLPHRPHQDPAARKRRYFHREISPKSFKSLFWLLPFDVWFIVFEFLRDVFPKRPITMDSLVKYLAEWKPPRTPATRPSCVPYGCCLTDRGARTSQAQDCGYTGSFERKGLSALMHVDCYSRLRLLSFPWYQAHYRFIDPAFFKSELPETSTKLFSPRALCLCFLDRVVQGLKNARHVELTLPSSNALYTQSTARIIGEALKAYGATRLEEVDLRFDWNGAFEDDGRKMLLVANSIRRMSGVNSTLLVYGANLEALCIAAEEDRFTWKPSDLYFVLRQSPRLKRLEIYSVLGPGPSNKDSQLDSPIELAHLVRLCVRDTLPRWRSLQQLLIAPRVSHIEIDIISSEMGMATQDLREWCNDTINIAEFAVQSCPHALRSERRLAAALHFQRDMDERYHDVYKTELWPEFMSFSLARSNEVLSDPDAYPSEPYFKFTERSVTTSTKAYSAAFRATKSPSRPPAWIFHVFWECVLNALEGVLYRVGASGVLGRIKELSVTSDELLPCPTDWRALLCSLPGVGRLYVPGILQLGNALIHLVLTLSIPDGREIAGEILQEIHLPDWDHSTAPIPVNLFEDILKPERQWILYEHIKWL